MKQTLHEEKLRYQQLSSRFRDYNAQCNSEVRDWPSCLSKTMSAPSLV